VVKPYTTDGNTTVNSTVLLPSSQFAHTTLALVGKGSPNYGNLVESNLIHLTENFFSCAAPTNPIPGQLWYCEYTYWFNNSKNIWYEWNATKASWIAVSVSQLPPPSVVNGFLYYTGTDLIRYTIPVDGTAPYSYTCSFISQPTSPVNGVQHPERSLKIFQDNGIWRDVRDVYESIIPPHDQMTGKLWYDQNSGTFGTLPQLRIYDGTQWQSIAANYLPLTGGSLNSNSTLVIPSSSTLTILKTPVLTTDAVNRGYTDTSYLNLNGTIPMLGSLNMNGFPIHQIGTPSGPMDAVPLGYVKSNYFNYLTGGTIQGNVILAKGSHFTLFTTPTTPNDVVNKQYVDTLINSTVLTIESIPVTSTTVTNSSTVSGTTVTQALNTLEINKLSTLTGGVVSGSLSVLNNPVLPMQVSTKNYVDLQVSNLTFPNTYLVTGTFDASLGTLTLVLNNGTSVIVPNLTYTASNIQFSPNSNTLLVHESATADNLDIALSQLDQIVRTRTTVRRAVEQIYPYSITNTTYSTHQKTNTSHITVYSPAMSGIGTITFGSGGDYGSGTITFNNGVSGNVSYSNFRGLNANGAISIVPVSSQSSAPTGTGTLPSTNSGTQNITLPPDNIMPGNQITFSDGSSGMFEYYEYIPPHSALRPQYGTLIYTNTSAVTGYASTQSYSATGTISSTSSGTLTFAQFSSGTLSLVGNTLTYMETTSISSATSGIATVTTTNGITSGNITFSDQSSGTIVYDPTLSGNFNVTYIETLGPLVTYSDVLVITGNMSSQFVPSYNLALFDPQTNYIGTYTVSTSGSFVDSGNTVITLSQALPSGSLTNYLITPQTLTCPSYNVGQNILNVYSNGLKFIGDIQGMCVIEFNVGNVADFNTGVPAGNYYCVVLVDGIYTDTAIINSTNTQTISTLILSLNSQFKYCTAFYDSVAGNILCVSNSHGSQSSVYINSNQQGYIFPNVKGYIKTSSPVASISIDYNEHGNYGTPSTSIYLTKPMLRANFELITSY
jgi:hypothetical protein